MGTSKKAIIIGGPTASGKTALAIEVAKHFNTEIISFDSRQCYREMKIGVARPSEKELAEVPHHFIASHSVNDSINAAWFESYALQKASEIFIHHDYLVLVGGTGLYARAFTEGLDLIPPIDPAVRREVQEIYQSGGLQALQKSIQKEDPLYFSTGEIMNPHRLLRALEVIRGTGKSIREFQGKFNKEKDGPGKRPFSILQFAVDPPREILYDNINRRVDRMIEEGLVDEVRSLIPFRHLPALNTVGYKEIFSFLDAQISQQDAIASIKQNTRNYAKRQVTWFKKQQFNPVYISMAQKVINAST